MTSWQSDKLWLKAKMFIDKAGEFEQSSPDFAFWSALSIECLARSALTHIHPALNADPRDDVNLLYAFGFDVTAKPRSLPAHSVYLRLEKIIAKFGKPQRELCDFVSILRNAHLHTSDLPFSALKPTKWLPRFYETIGILNEFIGKSLADFIGHDSAQSALELIKALNEEIIGSVKTKISAHSKVFLSKSDVDKQKLIDASEMNSFFPTFGEQVHACPACGAKGVLTGNKVKEFPEKYENGELLVEVQFIGNSFKCICCELTLSGVNEITHAGIEPYFLGTTSTSLHDLYEAEMYPEYDNM